jgi:hypothetical protein
MVSFLNLGNADVLIFGRNMGNKMGEWEKYVLDPQSWQDMWREVVKATGTKWTAKLKWSESEEGWIRQISMSTDHYRRSYFSLSFQSSFSPLSFPFSFVHQVDRQQARSPS